MILSHVDKESAGRIHDALWHPLVLRRLGASLHSDASNGEVGQDCASWLPCAKRLVERHCSMLSWIVADSYLVYTRPYCGIAIPASRAPPTSVSSQPHLWLDKLASVYPYI